MAIQFRTLDGRFASPKSRRKLSVFSDGTRLHGASAQSARKRARRPSPKKVRKPRRVEKPRLPREFLIVDPDYMLSPFGKFTKAISGMKPGEREKVFAIMLTKFRKPSYRNIDKDLELEQRVPVVMGVLTRREILRLDPDEMIERARSAGYVDPKLEFLVVLRSKKVRQRIGKGAFG